MTKEEAIKILDKQRIEYLEEWVDYGRVNGAYQMAIKALEQQTEDAISRQAVDTLVDELARAISDERCFISRGRSTATIMQDILDLPPVKPKFTDEDIQKMQDLEQAEIQKAYELGKAEGVEIKDCISRQAALDAFGLSEKTRKYGGDYSGYDTMMLYEIQNVLENLPSVTPQSKTGHWIANKAKNYPGWVHCSECGEDWTHDGRPPYCPACGARMIEPQERSDKE